MSNYIAHYGTKGMKWGVTNEEDTKPDQLNKSSLEEYKSKTSKYKEMRDKYNYKRSNYKTEINQYLDDMNSITDRKALMRQIAKYNEVSGYYNSIDSKLKKLDGVIANREKIYDERMSKLLKKQAKSSKTKITKPKTEKQSIKPSGKFYKPGKKTKSANNMAEAVTILKNEIKHHGIEGQKWGIKNGPPYPINRTSGNLYKQGKQIVDKISAKVEADRKPPTGNQNCQLCTWCAEANFRGINALPRPVYSPMDPELSIQGETIVKNPVKVKAESYTNLEKMLDSIDGDARYYAHVNWAGSMGGHEFLIIKSEGKNYVMDPQAGTIEEMSKNDFHLKGLNWNNSYFSRLDNKEFRKDLFDKTNDPKETLPWDTTRDVEYMYKEGMISKDEYDEVLKDPSIIDS